MLTGAILTVLGSDRPGLTASLAEAVAAVGGNWLESHLTRLRGVYVGAVLIEFGREKASELQRSLAAIDARGLRVDLLEVGLADQEKVSVVTLDVVGQDRPGIVHEVTAAILSADVNIVSFKSQIENSSWSGVRLFRACADLIVHRETSQDELRQALESISQDLVVDLDCVPAKEQLRRPNPGLSTSSPSEGERMPHDE
jgi:glycine cleavage system regulatory protein